MFLLKKQYSGEIVPNKVPNFGIPSWKPKMLSELRKPLINGKSFTEITTDMNSIVSNPKMLSGLFSQIRDLLIYIEPRIQRFVKDSDKKDIWLDKITNFKERYKNIVS